ncbi:hypothetical protein DFJ74DRAFT_730847 [Hyaloraphidium curvatum]|nr:hypothetical protein DFJ74DRAFT_730847 [Hyaloraphidium curvatum]
MARLGAEVNADAAPAMLQGLMQHPNMDMVPVIAEGHEAAFPESGRGAAGRRVGEELRTGSSRPAVSASLLFRLARAKLSNIRSAGGHRRIQQLEAWGRPRQHRPANHPRPSPAMDASSLLADDDPALPGYALRRSCLSGDADTAVRLLRAAPADALARTPGGVTALHCAAAGGGEKVLLPLFEEDFGEAAWSATDAAGRTPFYLACAYSNHAAVRLLGREMVRRPDGTWDFVADIEAGAGGRPPERARVGGARADETTARLVRDARAHREKHREQARRLAAEKAAAEKRAAEREQRRAGRVEGWQKVPPGLLGSPKKQRGDGTLELPTPAQMASVRGALHGPPKKKAKTEPEPRPGGPLHELDEEIEELPPTPTFPIVRRRLKPGGTPGAAVKVEVFRPGAPPRPTNTEQPAEDPAPPASLPSPAPSQSPNVTNDVPHKPQVDMQPDAPRDGSESSSLTAVAPLLPTDPTPPPPIGPRPPSPDTPAAQQPAPAPGTEHRSARLALAEAELAAKRELLLVERELAALRREAPGRPLEELREALSIERELATLRRDSPPRALEELREEVELERELARLRGNRTLEDAREELETTRELVWACRELEMLDRGEEEGGGGSGGGSGVDEGGRRKGG